MLNCDSKPRHSSALAKDILEQTNPLYNHVQAMKLVVPFEAKCTESPA